MSLSPSPSRRFHVVSLQVPFPPDYGGVIDIYYKLKALKKMGYETWLHTFRYDRSRAERSSRQSLLLSAPPVCYPPAFAYPLYCFQSPLFKTSRRPAFRQCPHTVRRSALLRLSIRQTAERPYQISPSTQHRARILQRIIPQDIRVEKTLLRTRSCQIGKIRKDTPACRRHFSDLRERPLLFLVEIPANSGIAASRLSRIRRSSPCRSEGELYPLSRKPFGRREHRSRRIPVTANRPAHTRHIMDIRRKKSPGNTRSAGRTDTRRTTHRQSLGRTNEPPY